MKTSVIVLLLFLCSQLFTSEAKLQQQSTIDEDDDDEDDDWDEEDDDGDSYRTKPEIDDDGRIYKNPRNSPSALCPRDEEQAILMGQKCLRKCSTDEDCKSKKKKCLCDGICGMSCIKPDRECPELTDIDHGVMIVTGRLFGNRVTYTCDPDYYTVGLSERTCRADGHWTGTTPSCKKETTSFCSEPPKIKNAKHNALSEQTTFDLDSMVQYYCNHGYVTSGVTKAKCLMMDGAASWFGPDIACEPQKCGAPMDIANGWHAGECYTYDCRVSYVCADGYELVGRAEKICLADGTWTPKELPQCVQVTAVQCPPPENPPHGKAVYTSYAYNSIVSYECNYGYTIIGAPTTRQCGADRRWTGQTPVCKEINCGSPGILYNGWIENIESGTGLGASIIFRCNDHMKLEGNTSSVCQIDGKWRYPLPQCLAPCVVPQIEYGHISVASHERDHINNVTVVEHGEKLIVECVQNYEFAANSTPVVCNNGTWSIVPTCSPARCKQMPKTPRNGMVIAPKTDHGMKAVFKCKDGFEIIGGGPLNDSFHVECRYGNWTGDVPHCVEVYCPFPGFVKNGKVLLVGNMGVYDYRPYVKKVVNNKQIMYDCDKGYVLTEGPPGATCVGGSWSPKELPNCTLGQHPRLRWSRRRRSIENIKKNSTINYKKFIEFFRKIGRKLIHLEGGGGGGGGGGAGGGGGHSHNKHNKNDLKKPSNSTSNKKHSGHKSKLRDEKLIDFLRVVYRKLQRLDTKHPLNGTNASMHELLNVMSKNFFHVDLSESRKNASGKNGHSSNYEVKNQKEFVKLRREFERVMRFYNKSMRWSEKQIRKEFKKNGGSKTNGTDSKEKKKQKSKDYYKGFYEFINCYVNEKLSMLETQNATEELMKKMNIDKFTVRNGTTFTINEMYAFFKHIIENKLNMSETTTQKSTAETIISTTATSLPENQTNVLISTTTEPSNFDNEVPTLSTVGIPKHRSKRIRNISEGTTVNPFTKRNLLSLKEKNQNQADEIQFNNLKTNTKTEKTKKSPIFTLNELEAQQQSRAKRFLTSSELENGIHLNNLYLNAYEGEYKSNVKRSILHRDRTNKNSVLSKIKRRRGNLMKHNKAVK